MLLSSPPTWELVIVYLQNMSVMSCVFLAIWKVRLLSALQSLSRLSMTYIMIWFNPYSIIKLVSFSTTFVERISGLGEDSFFSSFSRRVYCLNICNYYSIHKYSVQFSLSVMSDSLWPHEPQHARPPVHHQLPESTQTHVHWVGDAIQSSQPLLSPSPPALNLSQHQGLFKWVNSSHQVFLVWEFQLQHQSFPWTPRTDLH